MRSLVLLIDDESFPMTYYVEVLQKKDFDVKQVLDTDEALEFAKQNAEQISIILLDCMMPPGQTYRDMETDDGLGTGVFLIADLKEYCPNTPIVVLTNVADPEVLDRFEEGPLVKLVQKLDYPPLELANFVASAVRNGGFAESDTEG